MSSYDRYDIKLIYKLLMAINMLTVEYLAKMKNYMQLWNFLFAIYLNQL